MKRTSRVTSFNTEIHTGMAIRKNPSYLIIGPML